MAIVEKPGFAFRPPSLHLKLGRLSPTAVAAVLLLPAMIAGVVLRHLPHAGVIAVLQTGADVLGGLVVLGLAALVVWAFIRSKGTDARIDAWLAEKAEAHEAPVVEPLERR
jgi:hypothetical protein